MLTVWELDFYSRPLLDENKKKVWEVLVCESPLTVDREPESLFRYAEFCSSAEVNSVRLKGVLETAIAQAATPPDKIRFFRQAMTNMITKACKELGIDAQLSQRTFVLNQWLHQRLQSVYPTLSGFQPGTNPSVSFAKTPPQPLPDALLGEKWQFVTLPVRTLAEMNEWAISFGEAFPLGLAGLASEAQVPGLLIFSARATPLAAWMSGLEVAGVKLDDDYPTRLLLETGLNDRWNLASLATSQTQKEAQAFEAAKQQANGVHFLAIQANPETEAFAGFWLLQTVNIA
ncbi:MAG: Tab2/Atab2 family RNA-binding protein [Leptolyngbya sp. BL-A-14]